MVSVRLYFVYVLIYSLKLQLFLFGQQTYIARVKNYCVTLSISPVSKPSGCAFDVIHSFIHSHTANNHPHTNIRVQTHKIHVHVALSPPPFPFSPIIYDSLINHNHISCIKFAVKLSFKINYSSMSCCTQTIRSMNDTTHITPPPFHPPVSKTIR